MGADKIISEDKMTEKQAILFISAISPPVTGVTTASEIILSHLRNKGYPVYVVDYARKSLVSGRFSLKQFFNIMGLAFTILKKKSKTAHVYLVISTTFWGNLRDLFFLLLIGKNKRKNTVLHMHTATFEEYLSRTPRLLKTLVKKMFRDVKAFVVLGKTFINTFDGIIKKEQIRVVENCARDEVFIPRHKLVEKNNDIKKVNILYLGNLINGKGYELLADAYAALPQAIRKKTILNFAGEFPDLAEKAVFRKKITAYPNIHYHGPVYGEKKRELLWGTHIFCLPSSYIHEAQPISILEAYAAGCIVLTTNTGGIKDIFRHNVNGYWLACGDRQALTKYLGLLVTDIDKHKDFAFHNYREAEKKYTEKIFCSNLEKIITGEGN